MRTKLFLMGILLGQGWSCGLDGGPTSARQGLCVDTTVEKSNATGILKVKLVNCSNSTLAVSRDTLPWEGHQTVMAILTPGNTVLDQVVPICDMPNPNDQVSVDPGKSIEGEIDLFVRFPDFGTRVRQSDLIVFWSYNPALLNPKVTSGWQGGVLVFEQIRQSP